MTDDYYSNLGIPFYFPFYNDSYAAVSISSNGAVYFEDKNMTYSNTSIPGTNISSVDAFIAVFWDDLNPSTGGNVYYQVKGTAPNRRLIVQWDDVPRFSTSDGGTFQVILYESNGLILMQYVDTNFENANYNRGASATVGLQNNTATGIQYSYNQAEITAGLAVLFKPCPVTLPALIPLLLN